jgi:hypothetical protein
VYDFFVGIIEQQRNSLAKSFGIIIGICLDTTQQRTEHHHYCVFSRFSTSPFCFPFSQGQVILLCNFALLIGLLPLTIFKPLLISAKPVWYQANHIIKIDLC